MTEPNAQSDILSTSRRAMLQRAGMGLGSLALAPLLTAPRTSHANTASQGALNPRSPHFQSRAKRVIHIFMNGGVSQVDTFDPKPMLKKLHGKPLGLGSDRRLGGAAFASPFKFSKHGQMGMDVSELFPHLAKCVDDMCFIRSMETDIPNHEPGMLMMNTGSIILPRPSFGSWMLYGLGSINQSLPGFIVLCPNGLPTAQALNWRSSFLPGAFQGTRINTAKTTPEQLIANLRNQALAGKQQRRQLDYVRKLNEMHARYRTGDSQLEARIESLELAFRMQTEATDAFDIAREPEHIQELYGKTIHGRQMLMARRLVERGVRVVQVYHGAGQPWDSHNNIANAHKRVAQQADQPIAALLQDLKQRGMLEDTLVFCSGEIGRTPTVQLPLTKTPGRDHHHKGFTLWMAGGGVKAGHIHGETNELGLDIVDGRVHVHDLHATILHLMGFNHEHLTYRFAGRDFRLTNVHGSVVHDIIA